MVNDDDFTIQHFCPGVTSAVAYPDLSISVTDGKLEGPLSWLLRSRIVFCLLVVLFCSVLFCSVLFWFVHECEGGGG